VFATVIRKRLLVDSLVITLALTACTNGGNSKMENISNVSNNKDSDDKSNHLE